MTPAKFDPEQAHAVKLGVVITSSVQIDAIVQWCKENIGPGGYKDSVGVNVFGIGDYRCWECELGFWGSQTHATFYFLNKKDATFFKLKWGD